MQENIILESYLNEIQIIDKTRSLLTSLEMKLKSFSSLSSDYMKEQIQNIISSPKFKNYEKMGKLAFEGKLDKNKYANQPMYYGILLISLFGLLKFGVLSTVIATFLPPVLATLTNATIFGILLYSLQEVLPVVIGKIVSNKKKEISTIHKEINELENDTTHGRILKSIHIISSLMTFGFLIISVATGSSFGLYMMFVVFVTVSIIRAITRSILALQNELS